MAPISSLMARFEQKKGGKAGKGHGGCHVVPVPDADGNLQYYRMEVVPASQPEESKPAPKPVAKLDN